MKLDTRYVRTAPNGDETIVTIRTEEDVKYYSDLINEGFSYKEVIIHKMKEECESCSA